jgi:Domain of unknown function (DUF4129)
MFGTIKITSTILLFLLCSVFTTWAQDTDSLDQESETPEIVLPDNVSQANQEPLPSHIEHAQPIPLRTIQGDVWDEATKNLDYSKDQAVEPKKKTRETNPNSPAPSTPGFQSSFWTGLGQLMQVLIIILALLGIGFAIFRMLEQPQNKRIAYDGTEITLDNVDQYLHETDLDRFLKDALKNQNYALAIRLYYLQIIKDLSDRNAIKWSREKTNRDYQREMRSHHLADPFRRATRSFEQVWYGEGGISAAQYAAIEPQFKGLLSQINA